MKIIRNLSQIKFGLPPLAMTIGNFDGVHLGHLQILNQVKKIAKEKKYFSAVLTFEPHPIAFLNQTRAKDFLINNLAQKIKILSDQKIDYLIILPFNKKLSEISAADFIQKILIETFNIKHLTIGYDFTFGKNREGNFKTLESFNIELSEIMPEKFHDLTYSSTIIRRMITEGKIKEANRFLGKNFMISGIVNEGKKLAAQLGFPTMNLKSKPQIIKPKFGVYTSQTYIPHLGKKFSSITNFGIKPTIDHQNLEPLFETHIPNFSEKIYGKKICIEFLDFIRDEKKFPSLEELKNQIAKDLTSLLRPLE